MSAAKDGLLALSVGGGLGVLAEMMEAEVDDVVGPEGKPNPEHSAVRHGHEGGKVTHRGPPRRRAAPRERELLDGPRAVVLKTSRARPSATVRR